MADPVDEAIRVTVEETDPPQSDTDPVFDAPWQARGFAIAVALRQHGDIDWQVFQRELGDALARHADDREFEKRYYECWLAALEAMLREHEVIDAADLAERTAAFSDGRRDASEFVAGVEDHQHAHDH